MPEESYYKLEPYADQNAGVDAPPEKRLKTIQDAELHNAKVLQAKAAREPNNPKAALGFMASAAILDQNAQKAEVNTINAWAAPAFRKIYEPKAVEMIKDDPEYQGTTPDIAKKRQEKINQLIEQRGVELNLFKQSNEDDTSDDEKRARIERGRVQTPEEAEFLARRNKLIDQAAKNPRILKFDGGRPVIVPMTTSKDVHMGDAQAFQMGTKKVVDPDTKKEREVPQTFVALRPTHDEQGQEIQGSRYDRPTIFRPIDTDFNKIIAEKGTAKKELLDKLDAAQQRLAKFDLIAESSDPQSRTQYRSAKEDTRTEITALEEDIAQNDKDVQELEGPEGRAAIIRMRTTELLTSDPELSARIPTGSGISQVGMAAAGPVISTGLKIGNLISYFAGATPEEIAERVKKNQEFEKGAMMTGFGQLAHSDNFWAKTAVELPGELTQMALDLGLAYLTGLPITKVASIVGARSAQAFLRQSGRALAGMSDAASKRLIAQSVARFESRIGAPLATFIGNLPGMAEEGAGHLDRFVESEKLHDQADILDKSLKAQDGTVEGGGMVMAPDEKKKMEQQRDALRKKANVIEENMAGAIYSTMAVTGAMGYVSLDRIIKTGPKGFNVAELYMRKLARKKLIQEGGNVSEDAIEGEARKMWKTLTEDRVGQFMKKHSVGQLSEMAGDAGFSYLTELTEVGINNANANYFFKENEDVLGKDAFDEAGIAGLTGMITGVATGALSHSQKKRVLFDTIKATQYREKLKGEATEGMLEKLRNNGLQTFGKLQKDQDVVKEDANGKFTIQDDQDLGTIDAPLGFFGGLTFNTREEAEDFARDRWERAFDYTMDKALAAEMNTVDEEGNITGLPVSKAAKASDDIKASKAILRIVANNAAKSGKTTTNHFFAAYLKSTQVGGNKMLGLLDVSTLNEAQKKDQDVAAAILALATSEDAVQDPAMKAVLVKAGVDAQKYMEDLAEQRKVRKEFTEKLQGDINTQINSLRESYRQRANDVMSGAASGSITEEGAKLIKGEAEYTATLFKNSLQGADEDLRQKARDGLRGLFTSEQEANLFDEDGQPVADFEARYAMAYGQAKVAEELESERVDAEEKILEASREDLRNYDSTLARPGFVTDAFEGDAEAYSLVESTIQKMQANRAERRILETEAANSNEAPGGNASAPPTAGAAASGSATAAAPAPAAPAQTEAPAPAFTENKSLEASIQEKKATGNELTDAEANYLQEKETAVRQQQGAANKGGKSRKSQKTIKQQARKLWEETQRIYEGLKGRNKDQINAKIIELLEQENDPDVLRYFADNQEKRANDGKWKGGDVARKMLAEAAFARTRAEELDTSGKQSKILLFQTDEPAEDKSVPDASAEFDYSLARYETDDNGVQRRIYNYEALENLLFEAVSTGQINGISTPPAMRNPASLAMVFLRAQAYGESAARRGDPVDQRKNFRLAMIDIYGKDGQSGMAKNGKYQEVINDSDPIHKVISIGEGMVDMLEKLKKGANALYLNELEEGGIVADGLLPVGFFGSVAFRGVQYNDKKGVWDTVTVYALVNDVYSFIDKKTGDRKRAYKMIPVPKAYAEARTVFDARARQAATLESLLNSPISRGAVSLLDKRAEAKLNTREVVGMTLTELTEAQRGAEIAKIEDQLSRGEKRLEELGTSYNELKKISEQYSAGLKALKEAAEQSQALVAEASTEASERSKNLQVAEAEVAAQLRATVQPFEDAIEKERSKETPLPWVIEANKRLIANFNVTALGRGEDRPGLTSADRAPIDAARASLAEANQKYQDALAASAADQAALSEYTSSQQSARAAVANVNFFESRKQLIEKLKGNQPIATDDILNQLSKSPAVTATVRGYAQAVMQDLNDVGIAAPALRTEVIDGVEQVVETLGEYLHRTAQMAVNGMAQMWMRSRTEDILAMPVEQKGPIRENEDSLYGVTNEEADFAQMATLAFPNYDPVMNNRNQVIDTILLQPDKVGAGYVTMPMGAMGKNSTVKMQDLVKSGQIGFTNYIENRDGKGNVIGPNWVAMVNAATNEARSRGKVIPAGGIKLIKLSDGRWIRQPEGATSWYFLDKQYLRRSETKAATGLTWAGTKIGNATAAAIIDNIDKLDAISRNPAAIKNVIERYQRGDVEVKTPYSTAASKMVKSLGPNATMPIAALGEVLTHLQKYRNLRPMYRAGRERPSGALRGPKERSGDETDGALGMTEKAVTDFMEGGRYLEGTQAPQAPGVRKEVGKGTAKATFPGDPTDEMIDALLESMAVDQRMSQKKTNEAAGISDNAVASFFDNIDTIAEADDSELLEGEEDSGTLIDSENVEDTSIYSEDSGYSTGNTDTTDHQRLVEMLKDEGLIPPGVQNLGEFTLEQWVQGQDYARLEADEDPVEVWRPAEQREGFDIQNSEWGRRRLIPKFDHRGQLGILNPESPIRKETKIGDIIYIQDQAYEVQETGAKFKVGPVKPMHEMIRAKKAELQASKPKPVTEPGKTEEKMTAEEWMQQGNPYPRPSVGDIEGLINLTLGQSVLAATRMTEAQAIRSRMKRMMSEARIGIEKAKQEDTASVESSLNVPALVLANRAKKKAEMAERTNTLMRMIAEQANLLTKIEAPAKMQPMKNRVDQLTQKTEGKIVLNSDGRTRLQRKLVGTFWYRSRVKPAFDDLTKVIWDYEKDTNESRPPLGQTRNLILENLGVDASMTGSELLQDWNAMANEGTDEQKQALRESRIYIGSFISWLTEGAHADGYKGNAFRELKAEYASEIEEAKVQVVDRFQRSVPVYFDFKYMFNVYSGYHQKLDPAASRQMAGIMTSAMLQATEAIDQMDERQQRDSRARLSAIWKSGKYLYGDAGNNNQFGSMGDRVRAAMMPVGWTVPYTQEGIDTSGQLDQTKPDFDGKLQRPPYSPETKGQVDWITTEKRNPPEQTSTDKRQRDANIRPYYGVFDVKRVVAPVNRKLSKKEKAAKRRQRLEPVNQEQDFSGIMPPIGGNPGPVFAFMPKAKDIPANKRFIPSRLGGMERGGELDVTRLMTSLAVTDTILAVNPDLKQLPLEQMEAGVINIIESNRAARRAYHNLKDQVRNALTEHEQAVAEQDAPTEALFNLILNNWVPKNDKKGSEKEGTPNAGLQLNPEMTGAPETLFQGEQKNWKGRLTIKGTMPYPILELNPESATAETFGHEVIHWLNNVRLSDGTTLLEAAMGSEGYKTLMTWAENGDPPSDYKAGSVERAKAFSRVEERLANGVMAYFSQGEGGFAGAEPEIKMFANIVQRVWRQARRHYESEARKDMWGTPEGRKAMEALDDLFVHGKGAQQLRKLDREVVDEERVIELIQKRFPGTSREDAVTMVGMIPDVRKRMVTDLNQPIIPSTNEGLSHDDPFTVLYQFDHTPDVAAAPAEGNWMARKYRKNAARRNPSKLWRKTLEFMASFTNKGMVTEEMFNAKTYARGLRARNEQMLMNVVDDIRNAIDRSVSITDTKNKTLKIYSQVNSYMTANSVADRLTARKQLGILGGPRLVLAVTEARQLIDRFSMDLIKEGVVHGHIAMTIGDRVGTYLHRKFPMAKGVDLIGRFQNPEMKYVINNIASEMIARGYVKTPAEANQVIQNILNDINTTSVSNSKASEIIDGFSVSPALKARGVKEDELALLLAPLTGMETNPLVRITDSVRALTDIMAKHKFEADFRDAGLREGYIGLPDDFNFGIQFGSSDMPALTSNKLAAMYPEQANTKGPLVGYRATPEAAEFYQYVMDTEFMVKSGFDWLKTMNKINGIIKSLMTVSNWTTGLKNMIGGYFTYAMTGNTFQGLAEAWGVVLTVEGQNIGDRDALRKAKIDKARAIYDELAEDGLLDSSNLADFMRIAAQGDKFATFLVGGPLATDSADSYFTRKIRRTFDKYRRLRTRFYLLGDLFWKIGAYFVETRNLREVYAEELAAGTITDREVRRRAAQRTNVAMFSFEREPRIVKNMKAVPFAGNFISFQCGMLRAGIAGAQLCVEDRREAKRLEATNPEAAAKLRNMALKRGAGLLVMHALNTQLVLGMIASAFGWSEEKLEALRGLSAKWERNSLIAPLGEFVPGEPPPTLNLSTILPQAWHTNIMETVTGLTATGLMKIAKGEDTTEFREKFNKSLYDCVLNATGPFSDATGVTQILQAIFSNEDQYGGSIRKPHDTVTEKIQATGLHIGRMFVPGDLKTIARLGMTSDDFARVMLNKNPREMQEWERGMAAAGLKVSHVKLDTTIRYVFAEKLEAAMSINKETVDLLTNRNIVVSEEALAGQLEKYNRIMNERMEEGAKVVDYCLTLGMPNATIIDALKQTRVGPAPGQTPSKEMNVGVILGQHSGALTISRQTLINIQKAAIEARDTERLLKVERELASGRIRVRSGR